MNRLRPLATSIFALFPFVSPLLVPLAACAQTWEAGSGSWGDPGNWSREIVPNSPSAIANFPLAPNKVDVGLGQGTFTVSRLNVTGGGAAYVISDGALRMTGEKAAMIVGPSLEGTPGLSFNNYARVQLDGKVTVNTSAVESHVVFAKGSEITGSGFLTKTGPGVLEINTFSSHSGGMRLAEGILRLGHDAALGTGALTVQQGTTLELSGTTTFRNRVSVEGDFTVAGNGFTKRLTGNLDLGNATRTLTLTRRGSSMDLSLQGVISGAGGLTIEETHGDSNLIFLGGKSGNTFRGLLTARPFSNVNLNKTQGFAAPGGVLVQDKARLSFFGGTHQISGSLTIEKGAHVFVSTNQTIDDLQGAGDITLANYPAELTVLEGNFSGAIRELGASPTKLIKDGPGTFVFTGDNNTTGGTLVRGGGTFAINSSSLGSGNGGLTVDGSRLLFLADVPFTGRPLRVAGAAEIDTGSFQVGLEGPISGSGSLVKTGAGMLLLLGANTYEGGTTINEGTLRIVSDANLGAAGAPLNIDGGTLGLLGPLTFSRDGEIGSRGATIDTNGSDVLFNGEFRGEGGDLRKIGAGRLTIGNTQSFSGNTYLDAGEVILNGSVLRDVVVGNVPAGTQSLRGPQVVPRGIVFGGSGLVGGDLVNLSGTIAPGTSPGTLTVNGDFSQSPAGTLEIEIAGWGVGQFDQLVIGGAANLGGTVRFVSLDGFRPRGGDRFVFLTAAQGVNGTFSRELMGARLIAGRVRYTDTTVELSFARRAIAPIFNGGNDEEIAPDAPDLQHLTTNQTAVAHVLDAVINGDRLAGVFNELDRYALPGIPAALDLIAPEELSAIYEIGIGSARVQAFNLDRHLSDLRSGRSGFSADGFRLPGTLDREGKTMLMPDGKTAADGKVGKDIYTPSTDNRWSVFLSGSGEFQGLDGDDNAGSYDITTSGFTLGADYRVSEGFAVGILSGYAGTGADLAGDGHILVNSGKLGVYAAGFDEHWYLNALAAGGFNSYDIKREGLGGTTRGETDGGEFTGLLSGGYDVKSGPLAWGPYFEGQYAYVGYGGFTERGSVAPLEIESSHSASLHTRVGARLSYVHQAGGCTIRPEVRVGWQHEYLDRTRPTDARLSDGAGGVFRVEGPNVGRDSIVVNASVALVLHESFSTYAAYDGELGRERYQSHTVSAGVRFGF